MRTAKLLAAIAVPMVFVVLAVSAAHAAQPAFPDKPIRLIIGSAPGSGPDIIARLLADHLYGAWGKQVVVDSRPGVAGIISAEQALRANPDGYTWMVYVLMVNPQVPAKSVTELIALAKKSPGKLRYGSAARAAGSISPPSCSRT